MPDRGFDNYFGIDLFDAFNVAWHSDIEPLIEKKYGPVKVSVVVLLPGYRPDWQTLALPCPMDITKAAWIIHNPTDDMDELSEPFGLDDNVIHKLRFVLRTGYNSSYAAERPDLVEPGDFPYAGAGTYLGYIGGASGLNEEGDWWVTQKSIRLLRDIRTEIATAAILDAKTVGELGKYLEPIPDAS